MAKTLRLTTVLFSLVGALTLPVSAHQLWIEQGHGNAKLYFGEYGDNRRETSPGSLDKLPQPEARVVSLEGSDTVSIKKTANAFDLGVRITPGQVLVAQESSFPAWDKQDGDTVARTVWIPAARYVPDMGPQEPVLALDVFPTRHPGEFKVVFIGNPLAGATVQVVAASGWARKLTSNDDGTVRIDLPWKGPYAIVVRHTDKRPGERPGATGPEKYDVAMFVTTLTFDQPTGAKGPQPLPPAKPEN